MKLFENQNIIRIKINENHSMYWAGRQFMANPANAKKYKTKAQALRVLNALVRSAQRGGHASNPMRIGLIAWDQTHGLIEVCIHGLDDGSNNLYIPRGHTIAWLKGSQSFGV